MSVNKGDVREANASHAQEVLEQEWREEFRIWWRTPLSRHFGGASREYLYGGSGQAEAAYIAAKQSSHAALVEKDRRIAELEMQSRGNWIDAEQQAQKVAELTRQNTELQSRLDKWEKWVPADETLAALKDQANDSSLAAKTAYINGLEFHLKYAERQNTEQAKLLAVIRKAAKDLQNDLSKYSVTQPLNETNIHWFARLLVESLTAAPETVEKYLDEVRAKVWDSASEAWNLCTCCWSAEQVAAIEEISDECLKKADELRAKKGGE